MKITHVIRGEDHVANTPKQILIYDALGWKIPVFAHLPLILGEDRAPLSKRHGATSLKAFRERGFLPAALRNYLALLGWSPGDDREFLSTKELVKEFSLDRVGKRAAVFDYQKLIWLNGKYIRQIPSEDLAAEIEIFLKGQEKIALSPQEIADIVELLGPRIKVFADFIDQADFILSPEIEYEPAAVEKHLQAEGAVLLLREVRSVVDKLEDFSAEELETALRGIIREKGIKAGELIHPLRVALTGRTQSPGIFETMVILGRERVLERLDKAIEYIKSCGQ